MKMIFWTLGFIFGTMQKKNYSIHSDIASNNLSEHHMISVLLKNITRNRRGPSYWKLNTSVLDNKECKQKN